MGRLLCKSTHNKQGNVPSCSAFVEFSSSLDRKVGPEKGQTGSLPKRSVR